MTQNQIILDHLRDVGPITPIEAYVLYKITCLSERIRDLKEAGHVIISTRIQSEGRKWCHRHALIAQARAAA